MPRVVNRSRWEERSRAERCRSLSCSDLAVFKAFFNRRRTGPTSNEMALRSGRSTVDRVVGCSPLPGPHDEGFEKSRRLGVPTRAARDELDCRNGVEGKANDVP